MAAPQNNLVNVTTMQQGAMELLENFGPFCSPEVMNTKFDHFNTDYIANQGPQISFTEPVRYVSQGSLVVNNFQGTSQKVVTLTCGIEDKQNPDNSTVGAVPLAYNASEINFNVDQWMDDYGRSAVAELADRVQRNVASEIVNATYRFYGYTSGAKLINSYGQLDKALRKYNNYGSPLGRRVIILPDSMISDIVNNGLQQFAIDRNNEDANSWKIAEHADTVYYSSNILPTHTSGIAGDDEIKLTLTDISPDGATITLSGAGTTAYALRINDLLNFDYLNDTNLVNLTWIGHGPSQQKPSFKVVADADSVGDEIVVQIDPPIIVRGNPNTNPDANVNVNPLTARGGAGVYVQCIPSHTAGILYGGNPFYLAMPALPKQKPYDCVNLHDERSGVSIRITDGSAFGQNTYGYIMDTQWGKKLVKQYAQRLIFPLDGGF